MDKVVEKNETIVELLDDDIVETLVKVDNAAEPSQDVSLVAEAAAEDDDGQKSILIEEPKSVPTDTLPEVKKTEDEKIIDIIGDVPAELQLSETTNSTATAVTKMEIDKPQSPPKSEECEIMVLDDTDPNVTATPGPSKEIPSDSIVKPTEQSDDDLVMIIPDSDEEQEKNEDDKIEESPPKVQDIEMNVILAAEESEKLDKVNETLENKETEKKEDDCITIDTDDEELAEKESTTKDTEIPETKSNANEANSVTPASESIEKANDLPNQTSIESILDKIHPPSRPETPLTPTEPTTTGSSTPLLTKLLTNNVLADKTNGNNKKRKAGDIRECLNFECNKKSRDLIVAPMYVLSFFKVPKKISRTQFVCDDCFEDCVVHYEELVGALLDEQPLLHQNLPKRADLVEILDSSDEEDNSATLKLVDDTETLTLETLTLLEDHFDDVLQKTLQKVNIDQQNSWTKTAINHKLDQNAIMSKEIEIEFKKLQRLADKMYSGLYKNGNCVIEELPPFDLNTNTQLQLAGPLYPPFGEIVRPKIDTLSLYYAVRQKLLSAWIPCRVAENLPLNVSKKPFFKVKFLRAKGVLFNNVPATHLAYGVAPSVRLSVGIRVIALFHIEPLTGAKDSQRASFFPGVVAEPLQAYNKWRYLIFFDDGYAQYVSPDNVRLVCHSSDNVWEDVHEDSSNFIQNYLTQYKTQRPMVQVKRGQRMITEWNGKWMYGRVHDIDSSLVQIFFEEAKRTEWIYRGSTRLGPLFRDKQVQKHSAGLTKRNEPYVEYLSIDDDGPDGTTAEPTHIKPKRMSPPPMPPPTATVTQSTQFREPIQRVLSQPKVQQQQPTQQQQEPERRGNVAKKSSAAAPRPQVTHMNNSTIYVDEDNRPKGKVVYYTAKKHMPPRKYVAHECGLGCLYDVKHNLSSYSPLAKPLLSGWERQICKSKAKKVVMYRAPCGRRLRNMGELHKYLRLTNCTLNVENFDFDYLIHCLAEYVIESCIIQKMDLSDGAENMVVPCVNYYDTTMPPECIYSAHRIPTEGVNLNLDTNFMCGCDCEDDCLDKSKCQCWQLTINGAKFGNPNTPPEQVGYEYKRLPEPVPTGIYECNSRCKCSKTCLNRVAQHSLQMKLQVFKTGNRGWGLRCLNDVPKGSFICIYAGDLLTEQTANEAGDNYGDEYFAELDYIEVVENLKEGYEPDVVNDDDFDDDEYDPDTDKTKPREDSDDDEFVTKTKITGSNVTTRYNTRHSVDASKSEKDASKSEKPKPNTSDSDEERPTISFLPNSNVVAFDKDNAPQKYRSIRKFYGKHEYVYIMDAKKTGNIGRYFNHSCAPNLFVQNVFVDTHDLRFPWVAFFALSHIRAGTELTWNYNYDVGSVPGKVLYCQCGAETCRGRLL